MWTEPFGQADVGTVACVFAAEDAQPIATSTNEMTADAAVRRMARQRLPLAAPRCGRGLACSPAARALRTHLTSIVTLPLGDRRDPGAVAGMLQLTLAPHARAMFPLRRCLPVRGAEMLGARWGAGTVPSRFTQQAITDPVRPPRTVARAASERPACNRAAELQSGLVGGTKWMVKT